MEQKEAIKDLKSRRRTIWVGIVLWAIGLINAVYTKEWFMIFLFVALLIASFGALRITSRQLDGSGKTYKPGQGYWYYRLTPQRKRTYLTVGQGVLVLLALISWMLGFTPIYATAIAVGGIIAIQVLVKRRIRQYTQADEASLSELAELGIIEPGEHITAFYKDFESWTAAPKDAKIMALTAERLIIVVMVSLKAGNRYELRLSEIEGLSILSVGDFGMGFFLTLRMADDTVVRFLLEGSSWQDSPEQFIQVLLQSLDRVKTEPERVITKEAMISKDKPNSGSTLPVKATAYPVIRHLKLQQAASSKQARKHAKSALADRVSGKSGRRTINF